MIALAPTNEGGAARLPPERMLGIAIALLEHRRRKIGDDAFQNELAVNSLAINVSAEEMMAFYDTMQAFVD